MFTYDILCAYQNSWIRSPYKDVSEISRKEWEMVLPDLQYVSPHLQLGFLRVSIGIENRGETTCFSQSATYGKQRSVPASSCKSITIS